MGKGFKHVDLLKSPRDEGSWYLVVVEGDAAIAMIWGGGLFSYPVAVFLTSFKVLTSGHA
jgi:hypothetical protein